MKYPSKGMSHDGDNINGNLRQGRMVMSKPFLFCVFVKKPEVGFVIRMVGCITNTEIRIENLLKNVSIWVFKYCN